jgi:hypothetical protein
MLKPVLKFALMEFASKKIDICWKLSPLKTNQTG